MAGSYFIRTLGCKANWVDSQEIEHHFLAKGQRPAKTPEEADTLIVNGCAVTDAATRDSRRMARQFAKKYSGRVLLAGCAAETDAEEIPGVVRVGQVDRQKLSQEGLGSPLQYEEFRSQHPMDRSWPVPEIDLWQTSQTRRTRLFLKIQEGCNAFCTFCIIPYGRGPSRSVDADKVVETIQRATKFGTKEVILTGTNIGDYEGGVEELVERILRETELARLRLSSLDPVEISPRLIELMDGSDRLCPHFHVSLQSPLTKILRLMKRKYDASDVAVCLKRIAELRRDVFVGMDVITGFPGETQKDFEDTFQALEELPWSRLHVFPYSERAKTPATRLNGSVAVSERKRRCRELSALSLERLKKRYESRVGRLVSDVLMETKGFGYSPEYFRVRSSHEGMGSVVPKGIDVDSAAGECTLVC